MGLLIFAGVSEGGNIKYLTNKTTITTHSGEHSVAYDPINQRYLVTWSGGVQLIDKDGVLIGNVNTTSSGGTLVVYDSINSRYVTFGYSTFQDPWGHPTDTPAGLYGNFLDLDGNLISVIDNWIIDPWYPTRTLNNLFFNPLTGRFFVEASRIGWGIYDVTAYYIYDADGHGWGIWWWSYGVNSRGVFGSYNNEFLVTMGVTDYGQAYGMPPWLAFFVTDDGTSRNVNLTYNERVIGYDENLAQYMLLGDGYLINLNPNGTYAGERRIIQGLAGYNNIKFNDKSIAIDYERKRMLIVFDYTYQSNKVTISSPLSVALINFDGSLHSNISVFPIPDATNIKAAYDTANNRYILVWAEPEPTSQTGMALNARLIDGDVSSLPSTPSQSQGQGFGTDNRGTNTAPGLQRK